MTERQSRVTLRSCVRSAIIGIAIGIAPTGHAQVPAVGTDAEIEQANHVIRAYNSYVKTVTSSLRWAPNAGPICLGSRQKLTMFGMPAPELVVAPPVTNPLPPPPGWTGIPSPHAIAEEQTFQRLAIFSRELYDAFNNDCLDGEDVPVQPGQAPR